jgi:hypothetical protein
MDFSSLRRVFRTRGMVVGVSAIVALGAGGGAAAAANSSGHPAARHTGAALPSLDTAKDRIRAYYGDHVDADGRHQASPDSRWAHEVSTVDARALGYVQQRVDKGAHKPALVLDIDDTALSTYTFGANNDFAFHDTVAAAQFALAEKLPVIPATRNLARWAGSHGVAVFFITSRPAALKGATAGNLMKAGYPTPVDTFFLRTAAPLPPYLSCGATCTVDQYKSGTRAHLQSMGHDILADVGDQCSDLSLGHADATFKLPDPLYTTP